MLNSKGKMKDRLARRWGAWRNSGKKAAFLGFVLIVAGILIFSGLLAFGIVFLPGDAAQWGNIVLLLLALMIIISPHWK